MHIRCPAEGRGKKRSQVKTKLDGASAWTKRNKTSGEFMALKKPAKKDQSIRFGRLFDHLVGAGEE
jgi:hypothetical protein